MITDSLYLCKYSVPDISKIKTFIHVHVLLKQYVSIYIFRNRLIFYIDFITMLNKLKHNYKYWIVANNYCRTIESRLQNKCENYLVKVIIYYFISTKI